MGEVYDNLLGRGINPSLAAKLDEINQQGILSVAEIDDRALDALKELDEEDALNVLDEFMKSDLSDVLIKTDFLLGVMKTYRAKKRATRETSSGSAGSGAGVGNTQGPNEEKIKELLHRTGYVLDITTGQRKYGGPPPGWQGPAPGTGAEKFVSQVFIGKLPRDMYEDELVPLFEPQGTIYELRIMVDPFTCLNKGFAFCTYTTKDAALIAVRNMDKYEVRGGKRLGVALSQSNNRLFVGSIPKSKTKKEIYDEFAAKVENLADVIIYASTEDGSNNRGFAFLDFATHKDAASARTLLMSGNVTVFGGITPIVDWADPVVEPDEEVMSKVKVVYVRNLSFTIDESKLTQLFSKYGEVEKVKKLKDYAFIHFVHREDAVRAIEGLNGQEEDGLKMEVALAKPQVDNSGERRGQSGFGVLNRGDGSGGEGLGPSRGSGGARGGRSGYSTRDGISGGDGYGGYGGYDGGYDGNDGGYGPPGPRGGGGFGPPVRGGRGGGFSR